MLDYQVLSEGVTEDGKPLRRVLLVVAYRELVDRYVYACRKAGSRSWESTSRPSRCCAPSRRRTSRALPPSAVRSSPSRSGTTAPPSPSPTGASASSPACSSGAAGRSTSRSRALDLSPSEVEPVKRALSFAGAEETPEGFTEDQLATAREAARRQLQTFARELVSSLQFYQNQPGSLGIGEIALTGGTAHLPGLGPSSSV